MTDPHYDKDGIAVHHGDCLDVLRELPDASVDAVVTDPPYGLGFMGREWDALPPGVPFAAECLRVLKPGGHLLAFGGTRTWHRLACAIEDAGFEVRDSIAWMYGSGFPKSLDVSKAIDRARDDKADVLAVTTRLADLAKAAGISRADVDAHMQTSDMGGWWLSRLPHRCACPSVDNWTRLRDFIPGAPELDDAVWRLNGRKGTPGEAWERREVLGERAVPIGHAFAGGTYGGDSSNKVTDVTAPATDDARTWQGWGTALKPAHEPIVVARKPLTGTVAANVLAWGTGALNVDACRIEGDVPQVTQGLSSDPSSWEPRSERRLSNPHTAGRWPANVVLDEDQAAALDTMSTGTRAEKPSGRHDRGAMNSGRSGGIADAGANPRDGTNGVRGYDDGGASRFFYVAREDNKPCTETLTMDGSTNNATAAGDEQKSTTPRTLEAGESTTGPPTTNPLPIETIDARFTYTAKADAAERVRLEGVAHPTVKPLSLMRWLVRLVTPPGGVVLEPFAGSGTTVEACILEGFRCVAIEREADYLPLILQRIHRRRDPVQAVRATGDDGGLFDLLDDEEAS